MSSLYKYGLVVVGGGSGKSTLIFANVVRWSCLLLLVYCSRTTLICCLSEVNYKFFGKEEEMRWSQAHGTGKVR